MRDRTYCSVTKVRAKIYETKYDVTKFDKLLSTRKNFEFLQRAMYAPRKNLEKRTYRNFRVFLVQKMVNKLYFRVNSS